MTVNRVTQEAVESLSNVTAKTRVTQEAVEIISLNSLKLMATQVVIETLFPYIPETNLYPDSIDSAEAFGEPTVEIDSGIEIYPDSFDDGEAFGNPSISLRPPVQQNWRHGIWFCAGFDMTDARLSDFSMTFTKSGKTNITITAAEIVTNAAANKMFVRGIAGDYIRSHNAFDTAEYEYTGWSKKNFMDAIEACLNAESTAASWGVTFTVDLIQAVSAYNTYGDDQILLSITAPVGSNVYLSTLTADAIELTGYIGACGPLETGGTEFAQYQSHYMLVPDDCWPPSESTDVYEEDNVGSHAIPDSGYEPYGMERSNSRYRYDWTLAYQMKSNVYTDVDSTYHDNGCDAFFAKCRSNNPFIAIWHEDDTRGTLHYFLENSSACYPKRVHPDDDAYWNVEFKTICRGTVRLDA